MTPATSTNAHAGTSGPTAHDVAVRRQKRSRVLRRIAWGVALLGVVSVAGLSLRTAPVSVEGVAARRGDLVVTIEEMAKTRVRDRYVVSAPTAGSLLRIELRPGDVVKEGSVLASIVPMSAALLDARTRAEAQARALGAAAAERQSRASVARVTLAESHANDELARTKKLVESGSLPPDRLRDAELEAQMRVQEVLSARFATQMAAHEAQMAAAALKRFDGGAAEERFDVTAPVSGRVLRVVRESAGVVQPATPLFELGDPARLEIVSDLLTADAVRLRPGARATVMRWGGAPLAAHVRLVEPSAVTRVSALGVEEQRAAVVLDLDEPTDKWSALGDGYRVEVRIVVAEQKNALSLPLGAVFRHEAGWATYVIRGDVAKLAPVELGARSEAEVEVKRGLSDGERVVLHPSERVSDGTRIAVR